MPPLKTSYDPLPIGDQELPFEYWRFQSAVEGSDLVSLRLYCSATPTDCLQIILSHRDNNDLTLLLRAVKEGHVDIVRYLAEEVGADVGGETYYESEVGSGHPIHLACDCGHLALVKYFLGKTPGLLGARDTSDNTLLHRAARNGRLNVVRFLVEELGVKVEPDCMRKPLHWAASNGHLETVQYLIAKGADLSAVDMTSYETPFLQAIIEGHMDVVRFMVGHDRKVLDEVSGNDENPVHLAAMTQQMEMFQFLVEECSCDFDFVSESGWTPLAALIKGDDRRGYRRTPRNMDLFNYIVEKGADLTVRVSMWQTPLVFLAVEMNQAQIVEALFKREPKLLELRDGLGRNVLEYIDELMRKRTEESDNDDDDDDDVDDEDDGDHME